MKLRVLNFFSMKNNEWLLVIFLLITGVLYSQSNVKTISITEYKMSKGRKYPLIDLRTAQEYEEGHLKRSNNIDFTYSGFALMFVDFKKTTPMYLYCRTGNKSAKAAALLDSLGFKKIINLDGGVERWKEAGLPLVRD